MAELVEVASQRPDQFGHVAQRVRDRKEREAKIAEAKADATAAGFTVMQREPAYGDRTATRADDLVTPDGDAVTPERLVDKPGVAVSVATDWNGDVRLTYWIEDPKSLGFKRRRADGSAPAPMTEDEKDERREVITNNKAWASAEKVRHDWLSKLLTRKVLPKDAAQFVAVGLTDGRASVAHAMASGSCLAHQFLGLEPVHAYGERDRLRVYAEAHPNRAQHVALAVVLGGIENSIGRHTWRAPRPEDAVYFARLAEWGYALSDVEQIVVERGAATD